VKTIAAAAVVLLAASVVSAAGESPLADSRRTATAQGQRYGMAPDDDPTAVRVRAVFERIARAAGQRPGVVLEVKVLDTPKVILESLRGGTVVISRGAADLAGADDSALAFLLGHEIAHQTRDHHGLLASLGLGGASADHTQVPGASTQRAYHAIELEADRLGVLYAMLAGYRAAPAVPVLMLLIERSGTDAFHPDPRQRAASVRQQVERVAAHAELFQAGLWLLHIGRPLDAARLLEHFFSIFPAREVMTAIGVAYHREAMRHMPPPTFRHALVVDATTRAVQPRGPGDAAARSLLRRAHQYYRMAAESDAQYAPAQNNLAALHLDLGERDLALGHVNQAIKLAPDLAAAFVNRGAVRALDREWFRAEQDWMSALKLDAGLRPAMLNLAAYHDLRGAPEQARQWRARASVANAAPRIESLGGVVPGAPVSTVASWLSEAGAHEFDVPLGDETPGYRLHVLDRRGVSLLTREGVIVAIGATRHGTATSSGVRPGDPLARVASIYGAAPGVDTIQDLGLWAYPPRGMIAINGRGRVLSVWTGRAE
jgi:tetratricopeptide (TPR) repeat protein